MSRALSQRARRTYFNNPLVEESLRYLPAAVEHPTSSAFRAYLIAQLPQSSVQTRQRFAEYISQRFSQDGQMNLALARALARYGDSRTGREILYFEMLQASPVLQEIASLWLAELPPEGSSRDSLLAFLERRLGGRDSDRVATAAVATFRRCRKISSPKPAVYIPVWSEPSPEAFFYVLARLYPERAMVRVEQLAGQPLLRAMLWPRPCLPGMLEAARRAGHVSKISELDQYHQFTLADSAEVRLGRLFGEPSSPPPSPTPEPEARKDPVPPKPVKKRKPAAGAPRKSKRKGRAEPVQLPLLPQDK
ncbi:hypothetical protein JRI60_33475 [Archangium violaceum]|uniref:hypothetical protein n=1 Tax=Archangium violaceum TaxID=83451 RepID=UPI00195200A7|nr:hypothetical protein [Archangium violaceum]QRN94039.1 hypothetical protein JRI60_33475 [Archangium violaceum]